MSDNKLYMWDSITEDTSNHIFTLLKREYDPCYNNNGLCIINMVCKSKGDVNCPLLKNAIDKYGELYGKTKIYELQPYCYGGR